MPDAWIVFANSTWRGDRLPVGVLAQLVGQDQQAVERRAQLVRHVGEELGLVLRRERELLGLFLERLARLLDLLVLALDLLVLVREQPGLLLELLVGLLQLELAALQLLRERLRLRQQVLGARVRLDRVDHDADRLGQLVEERLVRRAEAVERRELEHALHLALEHDRHHEDALRRRGAEAREDRAGSRPARSTAGSSRFVDRALADQALAELEPRAEHALALAAVAREQRQLRLLRRATRARRTRRAAPTRPARARTGSAARPC